VTLRLHMPAAVKAAAFLLAQVSIPVNLQKGGFHSAQANRSNDFPRAQFVPNTPRNCGQSRLSRVSLFLCM
jgi:hypothetical protein